MWATRDLLRQVDRQLWFPDPTRATPYGIANTMQSELNSLLLFEEWFPRFLHHIHDVFRIHSALHIGHRQG